MAGNSSVRFVEGVIVVMGIVGIGPLGDIVVLDLVVVVVAAGAGAGAVVATVGLAVP